MTFFALGVCDHRDVCHTCTLRTRLIMEDEQCPICRADLDEIIITEDRSLTWQLAKKKLLKKCDVDPEDDTIYFHSHEAKKAALKFRTLNCMIPSC